MAWKIIEWNAENNKQRFQTAFTFIRAGFKMIKNKKVSLRINFERT